MVEAAIEVWRDALVDPDDARQAPLERHEFRRPADWAPFEGARWGVLTSPATGTSYPFCGQVLFTVATEDARGLFARVRAELEAEGVSRRLVEVDPTQGAAGHDGLFDQRQVDEYDRLLVESPFWRATSELVFARWTRALSGLARPALLDLGCGTGRCIGRFPHGRQAGLDLSLPMLERQVRSGLARGCLLVHGTAGRLPFRAGSIDGVTCFGTLHHVSSPGEVMQQVARVLSVGGRFLAFENNESPVRPAFDAAMRLFSLWEEEAGEHQVISAEKIEGWCRGLPLRCRFHYSTFVLPHLAHVLRSAGLVRSVLSVTERLGNLGPWRRCGGILLVEGVRTDA